MARTKNAKAASKDTSSNTSISNQVTATYTEETQANIDNGQQPSFSARGRAVGTKSKTKSERAGITFPVARVRSHLKRGRYAKIIGVGASVYLAASLEYLVAEVLDIAGNVAKDNRRKRIKPQHITLAVKNDEEIDKLFKGVTIAQGGVLPHIEPVLLKRRADNIKDAKKKRQLEKKEAEGEDDDAEAEVSVSKPKKKKVDKVKRVDAINLRSSISIDNINQEEH